MAITERGENALTVWDLSPVVNQSQPLTPTAPGVPGLVLGAAKSYKDEGGARVP